MLPLRSTLRAAATLALLALPAALAGQADRCEVVPDTVRAPTPQQVREADEMRASLRALLRAHGQAEEGLLMVDVDSTRRGRLLFMDAEIPDTTRAAVLAHVSEYLRGIPGGHAYQALVRMDATYPAVVPGARRCRPDLDNPGEFQVRLSELLEDHPLAGRPPAAREVRRAVVLLVISREGHVAFAEVVSPSGDAHLDAAAVEAAKVLRFLPATLNEVPIDVRLRFPVASRI